MAQQTEVQSHYKSYPKLKNWYLIPPYLTLSIISYVLGKEYRPPLHFGIVAIEKRNFGSPSTMIANFTYIHRQTHTMKWNKTMHVNIVIGECNALNVGDKYSSQNQKQTPYKLNQVFN